MPADLTVLPSAPGTTPCHDGCAACCIVVSIASPIPGMPGGKPAGVPCVNLDETRRCRLFGRPDRPQVCEDLRFDAALCGDGPVTAHARWGALEAATR